MDEPSKCFAEWTKPDIKSRMLDDFLVWNIQHKLISRVRTDLWLPWPRRGRTLELQLKGHELPSWQSCDICTAGCGNDVHPYEHAQYLWAVCFKMIGLAKWLGAESVSLYKPDALHLNPGSHARGRELSPKSYLLTTARSPRHECTHTHTHEPKNKPNHWGM